MPKTNKQTQTPYRSDPVKAPPKTSPKPKQHHRDTESSMKPAKLKHHQILQEPVMLMAEYVDGGGGGELAAVLFDGVGVTCGCFCFREKREREMEHM